MTRWMDRMPWHSKPNAVADPSEILTDECAIHGTGPLTGSDLSRADALFAHKAGPLPSRAAAEMSLELAHMTYTLDIAPWMTAGWTDFSFQVDDTLESDPAPGSASHVETPVDEHLQRLMHIKRMRRAQSALRARNPLAQMMAALRQRDGSDTVKAVCMMHPLPGGRHLLAIGFMGTGKRFYDWFSNLRYSLEDGFHQGFLQLCRHFEETAEQIRFPATAAALGLENLTLRDVLRSLRSPSSPFRLWMAGHSQGGAVMQVYTHRLLTQYGALPQYIRGCSFAAPAAASARLTPSPEAYPLIHILNRDDLVPRMGALVHLGLCLEYVPDDAFRRRSYRFNPAYEACRQWLRPLLMEIRDMPDSLMHITALVQCIAQEKGEDSILQLMDKRWAIPALDRMLLFAGDKAQDFLRSFTARQAQAYRDLTGQPMDMDRLAAMVDSLIPYVSGTPLRRLLATMAECLYQPHRLGSPHTDHPGAYTLIVTDGLNRLRPYTWKKRFGDLPLRHYAPRRSASRIQRRGKARLKPR